MGKASMAAGNPARAIENFQLYVQEYPAGADRLAVRFQLGDAQQKTNQPLLARRTWTDLAREIERMPAAQLSKEISAIRADALYSIASTYGIPNPPDDTSLNRGVAALNRFLSAYPAHPRAVRASHQLAVSYLARGKSTEALEAFTQFLRQDAAQLESPEARRDWAELAMDASFKVGAILQGQQKFAEAIAAWKGYLAKFPNGPQSADCTASDSRYSALDRRRSPGAIAVCRCTHRLDRASSLRTRSTAACRSSSSRSARATLLEKKYDQAIAAWESLAGKFPASEPAGHAQFSTASLYEIELGKPRRSHRAIPEDRDRPLARSSPAADRRHGGQVARRRHAAHVPFRRNRRRSRSRRATSRPSISPHTSSMPSRISARRAGSRRSSRSTSGWSRPTPPGQPRFPAMPATSRPTPNSSSRSSRSPASTSSRSPTKRRCKPRRSFWAAIWTPSSRPRATSFWSLPRT